MMFATSSIQKLPWTSPPFSGRFSARAVSSGRNPLENANVMNSAFATPWAVSPW